LAGIRSYSADYAELFKVYRRSNSERLTEYLQGLFHDGKHNIERMNERIDTSKYHQLHHFISVSKWDHKPVLAEVGRDISALLAKKGGPVALVIDEEGHAKKGEKSVGVSRQYLGGEGKVDNGQVTVFASLNQGDDVGMVNCRLYLPKGWTDDRERCKAAGIPEGERAYKTKWELALDMVDEISGKVAYVWVNADGFYGNSQGFRLGLGKREKHFVLDIHSDQNVYLSDPRPYVPAPSGKGAAAPSPVSAFPP
jgi:SRSO17 transposase